MEANAAALALRSQLSSLSSSFKGLSHCSKFSVLLHLSGAIATFGIDGLGGRILRMQARERGRQAIMARLIGKEEIQRGGRKS